VTNSARSLADCAAFAADEQLPMPPALVAPLGCDALAQPASATQPPFPRPYFVMLGTIESRKNHLLILNVWARLARTMGAHCPLLVIIGQRGWECEQVIDMLDRCADLTGNVIEMPRCVDGELGAILSHARALLFPSFVEGYGLPLVEALSMGTPVLASDLPVFRELAQDIPNISTRSTVRGGWRRSSAMPMRTRSIAQDRRSACRPSYRRHGASISIW